MSSWLEQPKDVVGALGEQGKFFGEILRREPSQNFSRTIATCQSIRRCTAMPLNRALHALLQDFRPRCIQAALEQL